MKKYLQYDNAVLVELLTQDDENAFTQIYDRYWQKLFVVAYNRLKERQTAEDTVHDVFASVWANRTKLQITSLENYLATAVKYTVLDKIKKREKERQYKKTSEQVLVADHIESALHHKRILEIVKEEVNKLPERCRLVFQYSRDENLAVKQIARKMDISASTVENQLNKALKHLKLVTRSFLPFLAFFLPVLF